MVYLEITSNWKMISEDTCPYLVPLTPSFSIKAYLVLCQELALLLLFTDKHLCMMPKWQQDFGYNLSGTKVWVEEEEESG